MSRLRHTVGAVMATALLAVTGLQGVAQQTEAPDVNLRAQMASITLDRAMLPGGFVLVGETFLSAEQVAQGDVSAEDLTGAGFVSQYVSVYRNAESGVEISSYVSAWTDGAAAEAGFAIIEDEARLHPEGSFEDSEAGVGEAPARPPPAPGPMPPMRRLPSIQSTRPSGLDASWWARRSTRVMDQPRMPPTSPA